MCLNFNLLSIKAKNWDKVLNFGKMKYGIVEFVPYVVITL